MRASGAVRAAVPGGTLSAPRSAARPIRPRGAAPASGYKQPAGTGIQTSCPRLPAPRPCMSLPRERLAEEFLSLRCFAPSPRRSLTQQACCDAYPRRYQHQPPLHAALHRAEPGEDERAAAAARRRAQRSAGGEAARRRPQHGGGPGGPPRGAGAHRQPQLPLLRAAHPLALQQDAAHRLQGTAAPGAGGKGKGRDGEKGREGKRAGMGRAGRRRPRGGEHGAAAYSSTRPTRGALPQPLPRGSRHRASAGGGGKNKGRNPEENPKHRSGVPATGGPSKKKRKKN